MKEPNGDETGTERGAAEEGSGVPLTPTEEEASRRAPSDSGDQEDETPGGGTAQAADPEPGD
jgi:hypothetical protein